MNTKGYGKLIEGTVIVLDLDKFKKVTKERGFNEYKPNIITGTLTHLVENFVRKWNAYVLYGLDYSRGTEEAVIIIPMIKPEEVLGDLEKIRREIEKLGATLSIGVSYGVIVNIKARNRREAYENITVKNALKALREAKRKGGNRIVIK
ncbi:MAG: GGDEF domain-containing protein [Thermoprotei archaeon]|nr:GGDEF domain-containing protein [Thermoprotei archaeon]